MPRGIRRILADQGRQLLNRLRLIVHQQVIPAACPVFLPVGHPVDPLQSQLIILFRLLILPEIRVHCRRPGVRSAQIRIRFGRLPISVDRVSPFPGLLQVLADRVLMRRFERACGKCFCRGFLRGLRRCVAQTLANAFRKFSCRGKNILFIRSVAFFLQQGPAGRWIERRHVNFVAASFFLDGDCHHIHSLANGHQLRQRRLHMRRPWLYPGRHLFRLPAIVRGNERRALQRNS